MPALEALVVQTAAVVVCLGLTALVLSAGLTVAGALLGQRGWLVAAAAGILAPTWWRRLVLGLCGLGVAVPVAIPASTAADADPATMCPTGCPQGLSGLPFPDLPAIDRTTVTVRPGDSLWSIAQQALPCEVADHDVAAGVEALYAANAALIGPDPDLIFPDTTLTVPRGAP